MSVRMDEREANQLRASTEGLLSGLPKTRDDDRAFDKPWEIRAFAMAVAAHGAGQYEWSQFQSALIASIKDWEEAAGHVDQPSWSYYEHWVAALETVLESQVAITSEEVGSRTQDVLATPANRGHHEAHLEPVAISPAISG